MSGPEEAKIATLTETQILSHTLTHWHYFWGFPVHRTLSVLRSLLAYDTLRFRSKSNNHGNKIMK